MNIQQLDEPLTVLAEVVSILEKFGVSYFVGGSLASSLRGEFRMTNDFDLICEFSKESLSAFLDKIKKNFYVDSDVAQRALSEGRSFNIVHNIYIYKVDFFTKIGVFEKEQLARASEVNIPGFEISIRVASAEDIILSKLRWYVQGGSQSERQLRDIKSVIAVNNKLDLEYLKHWAEYLEVSSLLEKILLESA